MNQHEPAKGQVSEAKFAEPWSVKIDSKGYPNIEDADTDLAAEAFRDDYANRIVSCVNALAGIEDPEAWVKAHRELVAKLNFCKQDIEDIAPQDNDWAEVLTLIAACEAAEGRKG